MRHKLILWTVYLLVLVLLQTSCEDVIDVELEPSNETMVIDGWIDNRMQEQVIRLNLSQTYFDNVEPVGIEDANVVVKNQNGSTFTFIHAGNGKYSWSPQSEDEIGQVGDVYELEIEWNGQQYSAQSTMNRVPVIDSIGQEFREDELFGEDGIYAQFYARDFAGTNDAYWIKTFKNGEYLAKTQELNIAYDAGFDAGTGIDGLVFIPPIRELVNQLDEDLLFLPYEVGDHIKVEIHSMSVEAFNFMEIARDQINNGDNGIFSLPLANTRTNVVNVTDGEQPLGFFNVAAVSENERTIR